MWILTNMFVVKIILLLTVGIRLQPAPVEGKAPPPGKGRLTAQHVTLLYRARLSKTAAAPERSSLGVR